MSRRRIYTRRGDLGETALYDGPRVAKDQARICLCGDLDELSSLLGVARSEGLTSISEPIVHRIQQELLDIGSEIVCLMPVRFGTRNITREHIQTLENDIDNIDAILPALSKFILPGGCKSAAYLHLARTVCRRTERNYVSLMRKESEISRIPLAYLNRLSDLLFVMARNENHQRGIQE